MPWGDNEGGFWSAAHAVFARLFSCWRVQIFGLKSGGTEVRSVLVDDDGTVHVTGTMSGGGGSQFDDGDAVDTDSQGNLILGATAIPGTARALRCSAGGTLLIDGSAVIQPVSGTVAVSSVGGTVAVSAASLPLPTGAATETTLAAAKTDLDTLAGIVTASRAAVNPISGQAGVAAGSGASGATTQRVIHSTDDPAVTSLSSIDGKLVTARTADYDSGAGTVTTQFVGLALPASGGPVAGGTSTNPVRTDPTGTTTQPVSGTVSATATCAGDVAHDSVDSGNPVKIGGKALSTFPAAVANADRVNALFDTLGRLVVNEGGIGENALATASIANADGTGNVAAVAAPGASTRLRIMSVAVSTDDTTPPTLTLKDDTTAKHTMTLGIIGGGFVHEFGSGIPIATNKAFNAAVGATLTSGKKVYINTVYKTESV